MKNANKRGTVYIKPEYHRALKVKAAEAEYSVSDLVNEAIKRSLLEDAEDMASFAERAKEPSLAFEDILKGLKKNGKI